MHAQKAGKYVFWDELSPFWDRGQSLVIYHHLNRTAPVARQTEILQQKFAAKFADAGLVRYFLFRRGSAPFLAGSSEGTRLHCRSVIDQLLSRNGGNILRSDDALNCLCLCAG